MLGVGGGGGVLGVGGGGGVLGVGGGGVCLDRRWWWRCAWCGWWSTWSTPGGGGVYLGPGVGGGGGVLGVPTPSGVQVVVEVCLA